VEESEGRIRWTEGEGRRKAPSDLNGPASEDMLPILLLVRGEWREGDSSSEVMKTYLAETNRKAQKKRQLFRTEETTKPTNIKKHSYRTTTSAGYLYYSVLFVEK
jgi:hypothetical protein